MKADITLTVTLDDHVLISEALRRGRPPASIAREIIGDVECRVVDAVRWRDGVDHVASRVEHVTPRAPFEGPPS